jgi:hypothetical protein
VAIVDPSESMNEHPQLVSLGYVNNLVKKLTGVNQSNLNYSNIFHMIDHMKQLTIEVKIITEIIMKNMIKFIVSYNYTVR